TRRNQQVVELDRHITFDTGNRRFAVNVTFRKAIDDGLFEAGLVIEHVMRNANTVSHAAGVINILSCVARTFAMHRCSVVVKLQCDPNDVVALRLEQGGRYRGIDTTGHGDDDTGLCRSAVEIEAVTHGGSYHRWRSRVRNVRATTGKICRIRAW